MEYIYITDFKDTDVDNIKLVGNCHYMPFDEQCGMGKTIEELEKTGVLVDKSLLKEPPVKEGYVYNLAYDTVSKEILFIEDAVPKSHEDTTMDIHAQTITTADDILLNMELNTDTNSKVTTTSSDSLLLMEMLVAIDEKLTQLLQPK